VAQAAEHRPDADRATRGLGARQRRLEAETAVRALGVGVVDVLGQDRAQVPLVERNQVLEALVAEVAVSTRPIRRSRSPGSPRPPGQTWRTVIANHAHAVRAADLFVVQALTFQTLDVLVFLAHGRRALVRLAVTAHPAAAWVWRPLVEATPRGRHPAHLSRDRDAVSGGDFRA
jgi:hypothetical protein